jgi:hypothetical protein
MWLGMEEEKVGELQLSMYLGLTKLEGRPSATGNSQIKAGFGSRLGSEDEDVASALRLPPSIRSHPNADPKRSEGLRKRTPAR